MRDRSVAKLLIEYGTLYKALGRLNKAGYLESAWEDPQIAADEGRPCRRFYSVTLAGQNALAKHWETGPQPEPHLRSWQAMS